MFETRSSHAKSQSISRQRGVNNSNPSSPFGGKSSPAGQSPLKGPGSPSRSREVEKKDNSKKGTLRILLAVILLASVGWYFLSGILNNRRVIRMARHRKASQQGGEAWILPHKMNIDDNSSAGFASEMNYLIRVSIIAQKTGYTLLTDAAQWNYGSIQDYFLPQRIYCKPPDDWFLKSAGKNLNNRKWRNSDRIYVDSSSTESVDDWIRKETLDDEAIKTLVGSGNSKILLESGQSVPEPLEDVYSEYVKIAASIWRPNDFIESKILRQRSDFGLGSGGVRQRKHSPSRGGNIRKSDQRKEKRPPVEEVHRAGEEHDYSYIGASNRADRGPLIGVVGNGRVANSVILSSIERAVRRLSSSSRSSPGYSRNQANFLPTASSNIVLTNDNSMHSLRSLISSSSSKLQVIKTGSPLDDEDIRPFQNVTVIKDKAISSLDQNGFNALPLPLRIHLTKYYIRDLTTLSLYADAFVAAGEDGQLALLIAGTTTEESVIGPRNINGQGSGGRVVSLTEPFRPTSKFEAMFGTDK